MVSPHRLRLEFSDARLGLPAVDGLGHKEAGDQEEKFYADVPVPEKGELELLAGEQDGLAVPEGAGDVKEDAKRKRISSMVALRCFMIVLVPSLVFCKNGGKRGSRGTLFGILPCQ